MTMRNIFLLLFVAVILGSCVTPLNRAAIKGKTERAKVLLAKGADVNAKDDDGWMALHYAAFHGHTELAEVLLAKGADANAKTKKGSTPLYIAAQKGQRR